MKQRPSAYCCGQNGEVPSGAVTTLEIQRGRSSAPGCIIRVGSDGAAREAVFVWRINGAGKGF